MMREKILLKLAWLLPRRMVYWCAIRVATEKCPGNPGDRTFGEAVGAWAGDGMGG